MRMTFVRLLPRRSHDRFVLSSNFLTYSLYPTKKTILASLILSNAGSGLLSCHTPGTELINMATQLII